MNCHTRTVCWKLSSNEAILYMLLPWLSGKNSIKPWGTNSHNWGLTGVYALSLLTSSDQLWSLVPTKWTLKLRETGHTFFCYLWYPPSCSVWLLASDVVGRRTTTITAVGCQDEIPTQVQCIFDSFCCGDEQLESSTARFKPGFFLSDQTETPFTKGGGTSGLNLALEDWSVPTHELVQHNTNH